MLLSTNLTIYKAVPVTLGGQYAVAREKKGGVSHKYTVGRWSLT